LTAQAAAAAGGRPSPAWAFNSVWRHDLTVAAHFRPDFIETVSSTHRPPVCFADVAGALCFVSTVEVQQETLTPEELASGVRWKVASADDQVNNGGVAQGSYIALHIVAERESALQVPRKGSSAKIAVLCESWDALSGDGTIG
jgi:hypothetical protein